MNFVEIYKILRAVIAILGKIFSIISIISLLFAIFTGNLSQLAGAILDGASKAVTLTIALVGVMGLWSGVMRVLEDIGVCRMIAKIISPILKFIFPETCRKGIATEEVAANISANMLGLGNAATPMGIKAMKRHGFKRYDHVRRHEYLRDFPHADDADRAATGGGLGKSV